PPGWNAWLRGTIDGVPEKALPPRRPFEQPPSVNLTGSDQAWRPAGSIRAGGKRAAATGDYSAWTPDKA
ncbi:MAG TPA: NADH-ubiquinone oxidoreductase subunit NDUFA12 family protein, partial [Sphingomicrobium sp.]|nr:NADH-ubiquinone oxidoreductase subunit NDUFA12 family protein [Sphingomicrobium sp.]